MRELGQRSRGPPGVDKCQQKKKKNKQPAKGVSEEREGEALEKAILKKVSGRRRNLHFLSKEGGPVKGMWKEECLREDNGRTVKRDNGP